MSVKVTTLIKSSGKTGAATKFLGRRLYQGIYEYQARTLHVRFEASDTRSSSIDLTSISRSSNWNCVVLCELCIFNFMIGSNLSITEPCVTCFPRPALSLFTLFNSSSRDVVSVQCFRQTREISPFMDCNPCILFLG